MSINMWALDRKSVQPFHLLQSLPERQHVRCRLIWSTARACRLDWTHLTSNSCRVDVVQPQSHLVWLSNLVQHLNHWPNPTTTMTYFPLTSICHTLPNLILVNGILTKCPTLKKYLSHSARHSVTNSFTSATLNPHSTGLSSNKVDKTQSYESSTSTALVLRVRFSCLMTLILQTCISTAHN